MNEHSFVRAVHSQLKKLTHDIFIWKINDNFAGGVPDAWYCAPFGRNIWIEYKFIVPPKKDATLIDIPKLLSPLQQQWIAGRVAQNISCAVVIGAESGILIYPDLDWRIETPAKTIKNGLKPKDVSLWIATHLTKN